jgi:hypothetical protein
MSFIETRVMLQQQTELYVGKCSVSAPFKFLRSEEVREEKGGEGVVRQTKFKGGKKDGFFPLYFVSSHAVADGPSGRGNIETG